MKRITLVLGGARSGKSRYAEVLGKRHGKRTYIATAEIFDAEMRERIAEHRRQRGEGWLTREAPLDLANVLEDADGKDAFVLIDCITVWLGNLFHHGRDVAKEVDRICRALKKTKGKVVVVANEVGLGIVPDNELARRFRDEAGRANQDIAAIADEVIFMAAGLPLVLKTPARVQPRKRQAASKRDRRA